MKRIMAWFRKLKYIVKNYDRDHEFFINRIVQAENTIKDRTDISADVHFHGRNRNQIIVTGRYRKHDYVQVFTLPDNELRTLIDQLKDMERFGVVDKVDVLPSMREVFERELRL